MGFTVIVEASYGDGFVESRLPTKQGGKAVFAFLSALTWYCIIHEDEQFESLQSGREWFVEFQTHVDQPLCEIFKPTLDCIWGDGGGIGGEFLEDEYEWYLKRSAEFSEKMTEEEFRQFIKAGEEHWSPINKVRANIKLLVDTFKSNPLPEDEGFYAPEHTIPDFESLYDTLSIFKQFRYDTVRLNFS